MPDPWWSSRVGGAGRCAKPCVYAPSLVVPFALSGFAHPRSADLRTFCSARVCGWATTSLSRALTRAAFWRARCRPPDRLHPAARPACRRPPARTTGAPALLARAGARQLRHQRAALSAGRSCSSSRRRSTDEMSGKACTSARCARLAKPSAAAQRQQASSTADCSASTLLEVVLVARHAAAAGLEHQAQLA